MGCEFEERETTICLPNGLGCFVDTQQRPGRGEAKCQNNN
jgi:hypothetical protein